MSDEAFQGVPTTDILVTVAHPWGDLEIHLVEWIEKGPGPRELVQIVSARRAFTGQAIDMAAIPEQFHNSPQSRRKQALGQLPLAWPADATAERPAQNPPC